MGGAGERGGGSEAWRAHMALGIVQMNYGVYHIICKVVLSMGVNELVFCTWRDITALSLLFPLAHFKERRTRLPLNGQLILSFFFLGLTGIYANQLFFIMGLKLTSPAYAAALQPAIPVFTFALSVLAGTEQINLNRWDGKAKVGGIILGISGATLMATYRGPSVWGNGFADMQMINSISGKPSPKPVGWFTEALLNLGLETWHLGTIYLIANCFCMAVYLAFQAPLLARYPAGLSVTAYSYVSGAALMAFSSFWGASESSDWILNRSEIFAVLYSGLVASALNYSLYTWSNKILGAAIVALYVPLQPLASSILAHIFLGSSLYLGSVLGGILIIAGLYCVTWGRKQSERVSNHGPYIASDSGKTLPDLDTKDRSLKALFHKTHPHSAQTSGFLPRIKVDKP